MNATPTALQASNYAKEQKFLDDLYQIMEVGKEQEMSRRLLQEITRADPGRMYQVLIALQRANGYTMRFEWHDPNSEEGPGKRAFWKLNIPYEEAKVILDKAQREHLIAAKMRYKKVGSANLVKARAAKDSTNGVVYSTGPDMPKGIGIKSFSPQEKQPKALVEAARQYGPKLNAAKAAYDLLKSGGIEVDREAFFKVMNISQDERLEVVSLVLPYIDQLEAQVKELKKARKEAAKELTPATIS